MKRIVAVIVLLCCVLLTGCSLIVINNGEKSRSSEAPQSEQIPDESNNTSLVTDRNKDTAEAYLSELKSYDYGGSGFIIASTDDGFFVPASEKNDYDTARIWRNKSVGDKFNVKITSYFDTAEYLRKNLSDSLLSGEYTADLFAIPANAVAPFISKGLLLNMASLPFTDFSQPYYNKININQASGGDNIYAISGDLTYDISKIFVLYFNHTLFDTLGIENPYALAKSGGLTWDKLGEIFVSLESSDSAIIPIGAEDNSVIADTAFAAAGKIYVDGGIGKTPEPFFNTDDNSDFAEKLGTIFREKVSSGDSAIDEFIYGNMLFYIGTVGDMENMKSMENRWGILPIPKENAEQENYMTRLASDSLVIVAPTIAVDVEKSGRILQAMSAASYMYIADSYYDYLLKYLIRDSDALSMLDCIRAGGNNSASLEMSQYFDDSSSAIAAGTKDAFTSAVFDGNLSRRCSSTNQALLRSLRQLFPMK